MSEHNDFIIENGTLIGLNPVLHIPEGVTHLNLPRSNELWSCNFIKTVEIPASLCDFDVRKFNSLNVKFIVHPENKVYRNDDQGNLWNKNGTILRYVESSADKKQIMVDAEYVGDWAFECNSFTSIRISEKVKGIGYGAFSDSYHLKRVYFPPTLALPVDPDDGWDAMFIGEYMENSCNVAPSGLVIGGTKGSSAEQFAEKIDREFREVAENEEAINAFLAESRDDVYYIKRDEEVDSTINCWMNMRGIIEVAVHPDSEHYKTKNGILYSKDGKTLVWYPKGRRDENFAVDGEVEVIGAHVFWECCGIKNLSLGNVVEIGEKAFAFSAFDRIHLPKSLSKIAPDAFVGCNPMPYFAVDPENPTYHAVDGVLYDKNGVVILDYVERRHADIDDALPF